MNLHNYIDYHYGQDGDSILLEKLKAGADPNEMVNGETLLHVAVRRRRCETTKILLQHGAKIDAKNQHGKTAYTHAARRGFTDITRILEGHGADKSMKHADRLAVAMSDKNWALASQLISDHPECVRTHNPEEDRLLADLAGRNDSEPIKMLINAGAPLSAPAMDDGTPLHQASWFGQPENARLLVEAGAPLNIFDKVHTSSPLGWAVHGSRYSGGAEANHQAYARLVKLLLEAGSDLHYPNDSSNAYLQRLRSDATPEILLLLPELK